MGQKRDTPWYEVKRETNASFFGIDCIFTRSGQKRVVPRRETWETGLKQTGKDGKRAKEGLTERAGGSLGCTFTTSNTGSLTSMGWERGLGKTDKLTWGIERKRECQRKEKREARHGYKKVVIKIGQGRNRAHQEKTKTNIPTAAKQEVREKRGGGGSFNLTRRWGGKFRKCTQANLKTGGVEGKVWTIKGGGSHVQADKNPGMFSEQEGRKNLGS